MDTNAARIAVSLVEQFPAVHQSSVGRAIHFRHARVKRRFFVAMTKPVVCLPRPVGDRRRARIGVRTAKPPDAAAPPATARDPGVGDTRGPSRRPPVRARRGDRHPRARRRDLPVDPGEGDAVVVPKGVWQKIMMREPGRLIRITPGPSGEARPPAGSARERRPPHPRRRTSAKRNTMPPVSLPAKSADDS